MEAAPAATGAIEGARSGTLAAAGALPPVDVPLALSMAGKGDGKGSTNKAIKAKPVEKPVQKEQVQTTKEDVIEHFKKLDKKEWSYKFKDGKNIYTNKKTKEIRWGDFFHNEIECNKGDKAWVIDPVKGKVLDKKGHLLKSK